jgi:hypothetical protein
VSTIKNETTATKIVCSIVEVAQRSHSEACAQINFSAIVEITSIGKIANQIAISISKTIVSQINPKKESVMIESVRAAFGIKGSSILSKISLIK